MGAAYQRGFLLYEHRRYEMAAAEFRRELQSSPDDGRTMAMLALSLLNQSQHAAAEAQARQAIAAAPTLGFAHYVLASILVRLPSDLQRRQWWRFELRRRRQYRYGTLLTYARVHSVESVRLEPMNCDFIALLAAIELDLGKTDAALALAERSLSHNPSHARSANVRSIALRKQMRDEEARQTLDRALASNPENPHTHFHQGWTELYAGNGEAALNHFNESLRLDPSNQRAVVGRGHALQLMNPARRPWKRMQLWMDRVMGPAWLVRIIMVLVISRGLLQSGTVGIVIYVALAMVLLFLIPVVHVVATKRRVRRSRRT